jgi:adenylosuccinate synthase
MTALVAVGTQFGDEGKGKIIDVLSEEADLVVRFQGGSNAGHTVIVGEEVFKFHLLPSGMVREKECIIGNGVVVDPRVLLDELSDLKSRDLDTSKLRVSDRAHIIMPYHRVQDALEEILKGTLKAGTTKRGIGPCYQDKVARIGLRMIDLINRDALKEKLDIIIPIKQKLIDAYGGSEKLSKDKLFEEYSKYGQVLKDYVTDTSVLIHNALEKGKKVFFEGAQGTHLCIDHGIYPYGTSSNCVAAAAGTGAGIGPRRIDHVMGVVKAYTSRVGTGPFPTELKDALGDKIRERGGEFGTTTGRPRRCGWLDLVMVKYSVRVNALDSIAITKIDVLGGLDQLKICKAYDYKGKKLENFPTDMGVLEKCKPIYDTYKGWDDFSKEKYSKYPKDISGNMKNLKVYLDYISKKCDVPIALVSYGPKRSETIDLRK